ncbi:hypothetical protein FQN53_008210, partial [Emmonsiellopsis sp. PD_33]
ELYAQSLARHTPPGEPAYQKESQGRLLFSRRTLEESFALSPWQISGLRPDQRSAVTKKRRGNQNKLGGSGVGKSGLAPDVVTSKPESLSLLTPRVIKGPSNRLIEECDSSVSVRSWLIRGSDGYGEKKPERELFTLILDDAMKTISNEGLGLRISFIIPALSPIVYSVQNRDKDRRASLMLHAFGPKLGHNDVVIKFLGNIGVLDLASRVIGLVPNDTQRGG